jgi:hypothetical protein
MKKTAGDHALAVIKAGLNAVPVVGGSIASLIGDYILTATQKTIERTLDTIRAQVEQLGDRIDPESVNRDEFSELFNLETAVHVSGRHRFSGEQGWRACSWEHKFGKRAGENSMQAFGIGPLLRSGFEGLQKARQVHQHGLDGRALGV